jgi:hypothetical protein
VEGFEICEFFYLVKRAGQCWSYIYIYIYIYMRRGVHQNDSISIINMSNISFDVHFNILWRDTLLRDGTGVQVRDNHRA